MQGKKGDRGDTGLMGLQGEKGRDGSKGKDGSKGQKRSRGAQGVQGPPGGPGLMGVSVREGLVGPRGQKEREGLKVFLDCLVHRVCRDPRETLFSVKKSLTGYCRHCR